MTHHKLFREITVATLPLWAVFIINTAVVYGLTISDSALWSVVFHGAGGFAVAWTAYLLYRDILASKITISSVWLLLPFLMGLAAVIGVGWEIMEYLVNSFVISLGHNYGLPDTLLDLVMDISGSAAFFFYWLVFRRVRRS